MLTERPRGILCAMPMPELQLELESDHGGDLDWIIEDLQKHEIHPHEITRAIAKLSLPSTALYRGPGFIVTKYFDNYFSVEYSHDVPEAA